jgi:hypothetical protein
MFMYDVYAKSGCVRKVRENSGMKFKILHVIIEQKEKSKGCMHSEE